MKKITLLLVFLFTCMIGELYAQCINEDQYPSDTVNSNNLGLVQTIANNSYTSEYAEISNITIGANYIFTCQIGSTDNFITVTDLDNNVLAFGDSPLTVEAITESDIRIHFTENSDCESTSENHITTLQIVLDCSVPMGLSVGGITTTNATFTWEPGGSETSWQVLVLEAGSDAPTAETTGTTVDTNPEYTDTSLTSANDYEFYVRANCGSEFSPWNGPLNFSSNCDPISLFNENFDDTEYGDLPVCWSGIEGGEGVSQYAYIQVVDYNFVSEGNSVEIYNSDSGANANLMLVSPNLGNLGAGTHRLKFFARSYGNASLEVGTLDSATADGNFSVLEEIAVTGSYAEYAVDFTGYSGTDTFIAFRHNSGTYTSFFLDDIRWEVAPLCPDVTEITIPTATINSATINWLAGGDETEWDVVYGDESATDPTTLTPISPAPTANPEATITGLTDATTYKVWVRSACGTPNGDGAWIGPVLFTTACLSTALFNENFDTTDYGDLPTCWSAILSGEDISEYAYVRTVDYNYVSEEHSVEIYNSDSAADSNILLVSPNLGTLVSGTHRLKFYARSYGNASIEVGTLDSATASGTFSSLETVAVTGSYIEYVVDFTSYTGSDTYIGIRHNSGTYTSIFLDDIRWEVAPLCADVTDIHVTGTTVNSASIAWSAGSDETQWDVVIGDESVTDPTTLTPITPAPTEPSAELTGLTDNTTYNVWVRSVCGAPNGDGAWIGPLTFTTACIATALFEENFDTTDYGDLPDCWTSVLNGDGLSEYAYAETVDFNAYSPDNAVELYNSDSGPNANIILVSPNLSTVGTGTHRVKFYARSYDPATLEVGTLDGNTNDANFSSIEEISITGEYTEYVVDFSSLEGITDTYIGFRNASGMYTSVFLDDIRWEIAPLCADVTAVAVTDITTETANVSWESQGSETNWQVVYGEASITDPTTLTPSGLLTNLNFPISELTENTSYNVWVRSACGDPNGNGVWIGPIFFTTQCLPTTVPFTQDFESADIPDLPSCSSAVNLGNGNSWETNDIDNYGFNSNVLQYLYDWQDAADAWFFTQGINLIAGNEYVISYKYGSNSTDYEENLKVMYGPSADADNMTNELANYEGFSFDVAETDEVYFTPEATGVYYFGFNVYSMANQYNVYIDDISIQASLATGEFDVSEFKFYPNPVKDVLNLSYAQNISNVAVFNILGQKVIENTINTNATQVDMSALSSGTYIVKVTSDNQTKTIKVIKE